ncbi:MAG: hypothetical protein LBQ93_02000, partial [Treponema sp.]|nr:hypothetical protein [Treponema sp.]
TYLTTKTFNFTSTLRHFLVNCFSGQVVRHLQNIRSAFGVPFQVRLCITPAFLQRPVLLLPLPYARRLSAAGALPNISETSRFQGTFRSHHSPFS